MKNILITGGAGFIGSNLALTLIDSRYEVTVLDNLSEQIHGSNAEISSSLYRSIAGKVNFINGSVTNINDVKKAIANQDTIVHLAAETGTGQSMYQIERYTNVNIGGTALLLDVLANNSNQVKKLILASSRAIYGEGKYRCPDKGFVYPGHRADADMKNGDFEVKYPGCSKLELVPTDEEAKLHPSSVYGITKQTQEQLVTTVCPTIGISPVCLRFQNVYGPGQSLNNPYTGILSIFTTLIRNGKEINIFEDGKESRDFVFIDDIVNAIKLSIENEAANNQILNVGTGVATNVLTVVQELLAAYQQNVSLNISGNYRLGDIRHNVADIGKISSLLGFSPTVSFKEGIQRFAAWVSEQEITDGGYHESLEEMKQKGLFK